MKRTLSVLLAIVMILSMFPTTVAYATSGEYNYTVAGGKVTITGFTGYGGNITIPSTIDGYPVTAIGASAFKHSKHLTGVIIPNSVTVIGSDAFNGCNYLSSVTIGDNVKTIGESAFSNCERLIDVTIGNRVTTIGDYAFYKCTSLDYVTLGNSVTSIGKEAFYSCTSLTELSFPRSLTTIGVGAFEACTRLASVVIPDSVKTMDQRAFYGCKGLTAVTIGDGVKTISYDTFTLCEKLTRLTIGDSVTTIGAYAFTHCRSLTSVTIPDSVVNIEESAFDCCTSLTSVKMGIGVTTIGNFAFDCEKLTDVYYDGTEAQWKAISIGEGNFWGATIHWIEEPVWGDFDPESCNGRAYCEVCGEAAGAFKWVKISSAPGYIDNTGGNKTHGHYYLANDYTYNNAAQFIGLNKIGACLNLNGHKLTTTSRLFITGDNAEIALNIIAGKGGTIEYDGTNHDGGIINSTASLNIIGGSYTSTQTVEDPKPILQSSGPANLTDAIVTGVAEVTNTMTISGTTSFDYLTLSGSGKLIISAGWSGDMVLNISDEDIENGLIKANRVFVVDRITGTISLADGRSVYKEGNQLKVEGDLPGINENLILNEDNEAICQHCGEKVVWTPLADGESIGTIAANNNRLHFYLTEDNNTTGYFIRNTAGTGTDSICLHLNGHNLSSGGFVLQQQANFALMGNGVVTCNTDGRLMEIWTAKVTIYGGTFNDANSNSVIMMSGGGNVTLIGNTTFNLPFEMTSGFLWVGGTASFTDLRITGGKLVFDLWAGTMVLSVPEADIGENTISADRVEVWGNIDNGTVTMSDGRATTNQLGQLMIVSTPTKPPEFDETAATNWCEHCKEYVTWYPLRAGDHFGNCVAQHYHYYLAEDMTSGAAQGGNYYGILPDLGVDTTAKFKLCLQLNGKELTTQGVFYCGREWDINIMGNGKIINGGTEPMFRVFTCDVNLYGGTYVANANSDMSVIAMERSGANVYLHNYVKINGKVTATTGNLYVDKYASILDLQITEGKMTIDADWSGTICLTVPKADIVDNLIKASRVEVKGYITGNLALSTGEELVNDTGILKIKEKKPIEAPDAADYTYSVENTKATITGYTGSGGNITIPSILRGHPVVAIGVNAFYGCNSLTSVTIPVSVTKIGETAFSSCNRLTDVYYCGTKEQWNAIDIGRSNDSLTNATIHFTSQENHQASNGDETFATLQDALDAYKSGIIQLLADAKGLKVTKNAVVDLNGFNVASVTVTAGTLTILDSKTDDYTVADGDYGKIAVISGNVKPADSYIALTETDGTSYHKVSMEITDMTLRTENAGIYYNCDFRGDEMVAAKATSYGVALSLKGVPVIGEKGTGYSVLTNFASGSTPSTLLKNVLNETNTAAKNNRNADMLIYGRAYIQIGDSYVYSETVSRSFRQQVELVDLYWNTFTTAQKLAALTMYRTYREEMATWTLPNMKASA